jgi:hypothetical protein
LGEVTPVFRIAYADATSLLKLFRLGAFVTTFGWGSAALADGSSTPYGGGGSIPVGAIVRHYNQTHELFRIEGHCQSSCTTLLAIKNVCVDQNATLLFHAWLSPRTRNQKPNPAKQSAMLNSYNARLRNFLIANHYVDTFDFHTISGGDIIHKFGYRECPKK